MFRPVARLAQSSPPFQSSIFTSRALRRPSPLSRISNLNPRNRAQFYSIFRDSPSREFHSKRSNIWIIIGLNTTVFAAWQVVIHPKLVQLSQTDRWQLTQFLRANFLTSSEHIKAGYWWTPSHRVILTPEHLALRRQYVHFLQPLSDPGVHPRSQRREHVYSHPRLRNCGGSDSEYI